MLAAFVLIAGLLLFFILDGRRLASSAPTTRARFVDNEGAPPPVAALVRAARTSACVAHAERHGAAASDRDADARTHQICAACSRTVADLFG